MAGKLVVLAFDGASTAETVMDAIKDMQRRGLIELEDAVVVSRAPHAERVHMVAQANPDSGMAMYRQGPSAEVEIKQTDSRRGRTAAKGAGIGLLAGWLLGGPIGGAAIGAVIGALRDRGIDDGFIKELSEQLHPDSSGIFLLVSRADTDKVLEEIHPYKGRVIHTTIRPEVEQALRKALEKEA
jgi:uncharacterized membrane protein